MIIIIVRTGAGGALGTGPKFIIRQFKLGQRCWIQRLSKRAGGILCERYQTGICVHCKAFNVVRCRQGRNVVHVGIGYDAHLHVHHLQLLDEQFKCIRYLNHAERPPVSRNVYNLCGLQFLHIAGVFYGSVHQGTHEQVLRFIVNCDHSCGIAYGDKITGLFASGRHGLFQKMRGPVRNNGIAFHFSYPQPAVVGPTLNRLSR